MDSEKVASLFHGKYYGKIKPVKTILGYVDTAIIEIDKLNESSNPINDYLLIKGNAQKIIISELKKAGYNVKLTDIQSPITHNKIKQQISISL